MTLHSYRTKSGKRKFVSHPWVREDKTPYVQDPETGLIIGREKKRVKG